ncbi:hypothetical protein [Leucobacter sp.]
MVETSARRRSRLWWAGAAAVGLVLIGGVTWGILANTPSASDPVASPGVPPQVTDLPTPEPGETTPVEKTEDPLELAMTERAEPIEDAFVEVVSIDAITAGKGIPGEPKGPAVKVEVRIVNESEAAVSTAGASVNLTYNGDDRTPAVSLIDDATVNWPAEVPAGSDASAVLVFAVPLAVEGNVRVIVDLLATGPDVVFEGPRPE